MILHHSSLFSELRSVFGIEIIHVGVDILVSRGSAELSIEIDNFRAFATFCITEWRGDRGEGNDVGKGFGEIGLVREGRHQVFRGID